MAGTQSASVTSGLTAKILGEDWIDVSVGNEIWTDVTVGSEVWSQQSVNTATWARI
jgi:hypothetical protein